MFDITKAFTATLTHWQQPSSCSFVSCVVQCGGLCVAFRAFLTTCLQQTFFFGTGAAWTTLCTKTLVGLVCTWRSASTVESSPSVLVLVSCPKHADLNSSCNDPMGS